MMKMCQIYGEKDYLQNKLFLHTQTTFFMPVNIPRVKWNGNDHDDDDADDDAIDFFKMIMKYQIEGELDSLLSFSRSLWYKDC